MLSPLRLLGRHNATVRPIAIRTIVSSLSFEAIEKAAGRHAANHFIKSMDSNSNYIDTPTICVSDPANVKSWEWAASLDSKPKLTIEEIVKMSKSSHVDAFQLVEKDISTLSGGIKELLGSDHPVLEACAKYFFEIDGGKKIRPTMVLAVSYALNAQTLPVLEKGGHRYGGASPTQKRLAEITEMIHTASLFHDDVIDKASTRRGVPSVNQAFGNKLAILGGDFLLSKASISLARLRNLEVVELLSTVIEHLVKGEVMQMRPSSTDNTNAALEYYLRKNFYKVSVSVRVRVRVIVISIISIFAIIIRVRVSVGTISIVIIIRVILDYYK
jgi:hypothetical protein